MSPDNERRARMDAFLHGRREPVAKHVAKVVLPKVPYVASAETLARRTDTKGHACSAETRAKISASKTGQRKSPEHRAALSAALLGRKRPPEVGAKISAALKGVPLSAAHRAALVIAQRARRRS